MTRTTEQERALSSLRHLYQQMAGGMVKDSAQAKRIAEGLLSPAIAKLDQAARRAPAAPEAASMISSREVVSNPGSGVTVTRINLSDVGRAALQSKANHIEDAAPQPPEKDNA